MDPAVWEAKDRLFAAQTALNAAASLFQGHPDKALEAQAYAHAFWHFLQEAKEGRQFVPDSLLMKSLPPVIVDALGIEDAEPWDHQ